MSTPKSSVLSPAERPPVTVVHSTVYYERIGDVVDCCREAITLIQVLRKGPYAAEVDEIGKKFADLQREVQALHTASHVSAHGVVSPKNSIFAMA